MVAGLPVGEGTTGHGRGWTREGRGEYLYPE